MNTRQKSLVLAALAIFGLLTLGAVTLLFVSSADGADFADVFNEPTTSVTTEVEISWSAGEPLLRPLEPQTIETIEFAWVRSLSAVERAAIDGDRSGVDVWFSGSAKDQVLEILATGATSTNAQWASHDIEPNFYSVDGQIVVAHIDRTITEGEGDTVRAVFILRDGNWRVEHLTRLDTAPRDGRS